MYIIIRNCEILFVFILDTSITNIPSDNDINWSNIKELIKLGKQSVHVNKATWCFHPGSLQQCLFPSGNSHLVSVKKRLNLLLRWHEPVYFYKTRLQTKYTCKRYDGQL